MSRGVVGLWWVRARGRDGVQGGSSVLQPVHAHVMSYARNIHAPSKPLPVDQAGRRPIRRADYRHIKSTRSAPYGTLHFAPRTTLQLALARVTRQGDGARFHPLSLSVQLFRHFYARSTTSINVRCALDAESQDTTRIDPHSTIVDASPAPARPYSHNSPSNCVPPIS